MKSQWGFKMKYSDQRRLGKLPVRHDGRTLKLAQYSCALAPAPATCDHTGTISQLGMMRNDVLGDCTVATVGHMIQAWTAEDGNQVIIPDDDIINMYSAVSGYVPGQESTDQGAVVLDVLNYWRKTGLDGHMLGAYVALQLKNHKEAMQAVYYFGAAYLGLALPVSAQTQKVWTVPPEGLQEVGEPGSWGGHAVPLVAYNVTGPLCITWGKLQQMTWDFYDAYCEEAYACFSQDIVGEDGKSPEGFDSAQLKVDLSEISA
jgi:hypothetical protein